MPDGAAVNPFPGLRPFGPDEDHLFFGREKEVDELLRRLRSNRFLSVVGTSGSGKSSLVQSGLIPSLHSGAMAISGATWRIAVLRPGEDPIGHLAAALDAPDVLGAVEGEWRATNQMLLDVTLRRGTLGLIEAVRHARLADHERLLVVVDQFEELFRFRRSRQMNDSRDEAVAFVKLILEATKQAEIPIYVVLTMRSDFIGDCLEYPGLPEAVNAGQYLVPRMTRDELRSAITGPIAVAGGAIASRLVLKLLNDVGTDHDQLPLLQHALMRTWDEWKKFGLADVGMDLSDYEAVGTIQHALSRHAEEAFQETGTERRQLITERMFKALTDTFSDSRGIRRPSSIAELAAIAEAPEAEVMEIVEIFRRPGRSFLMPPDSVALNSRVIVDLSHESLMRCWGRLIQWAEDERASAATYVRLAREARFFEQGAAGLWDNPQLELGVRWRDESRPTAAWASRYDPSFDRAMNFLNRSEEEFRRQKAERAAARRRALRQAQVTAAILGVLLIYAIWNGIVARGANRRAELNLQYARRAVDESLALVDRDTARLGIDHPTIIVFQRDLASKAKTFYDAFIQQVPDSEDLRQSVGQAHFKLGQVHRLLNAPDTAVAEYGEAITAFEALVRDFPGNASHRRALGNAYNYLGETLRPMVTRRREAMDAYVRALELQQQLQRGEPANADYQQELARTHYNRGILHAEGQEADPSEFALAEADFREAIRLLEALVAREADPARSQELARAYNNLGSALVDHGVRIDEAKDLYARAVKIDETLAASQPANREYRMELATFYNNQAEVHRQQGDFDLATQRNNRALDLIDQLSRPAPSLGIERADGLNLRGLIIESRGSGDVVSPYAQSFGFLRDLALNQDGSRLPRFHLRFGDLLNNLAVLRTDRPRSTEVARLLAEALGFYATLAQRTVTVGTAEEAQSVLQNFDRLEPLLSAADRKLMTANYGDLQGRLRKRAESRR